MDKIGKKIVNFILLTSLLIGLFLINYYNNDLLHAFLGVLRVVVAISIYTIAWNARSYLKNNFLLFIGIASFFIGSIDLLDLLINQGIIIFPEFNVDNSILFLVSSRYMLAITLLVAIAFLYKQKNIKPIYIFSTYAILLVILIAIIFYLSLFSFSCQVVQGSSIVILLLDYGILGILFITLFLLIKNRRKFDSNVYRYILWSIICTIFSELALPFCTSIEGYEQNVLGHYFRILSYCLVYKAIVETGIKKPFDLIFRELKLKEEELENRAITDDLTGVLNRRAAFEILEKILKLSQRNKQLVTICFIDIDDLKLINDSFGHGAGDNLLFTFATTVEESIRDSDFICRLGGDEFLLILPDCSIDEAEKLLQRVKENIELINNKEDEKGYKINFNYGLAVYDFNENINVDKLIELADSNMYKNKEYRKHDEIQLTLDDLNDPSS